MTDPSGKRRTPVSRDRPPARIPKLRVDDGQVTWPHHHRGGWGAVVAHLRAQLHAEDGVRFVGAAEDAFTGGEPIREPWVGFVHQVPLNDTRFLPDLHRLIHLRPWTEKW